MRVGAPPLDLSAIRLDYYETEDGFSVVSTFFAEYLNEMRGDAVSFLAIGTTGYHLLQCHNHVAPPVDSRRIHQLNQQTQMMCSKFAAGGV